MIDSALCHSYIRGHLTQGPLKRFFKKVHELMEGGVREGRSDWPRTHLSSDMPDTADGRTPALAKLMQQVAEVVRPYRMVAFVSAARKV